MPRAVTEEEPGAGHVNIIGMKDEVLAASDKRSYSGSYYDQEKLLALQDTSILYFIAYLFCPNKSLITDIKVSPKDRLTRHCFDRNIYRDALIYKSMVSLTVFPLAGFVGVEISSLKSGLVPCLTFRLRCLRPRLLLSLH